MVIKSDTGILYEVANKTAVAFQKIEKRWYVCFRMKGAKSSDVTRLAVKHTAIIKGGAMK